MKKKVVVSVSNDLENDQRVRKQCHSLHEAGYEIVLLGRKRTSSNSIKRPYRVKRFSLLFNIGALFYAFLNFRLFWFLLWEKADILWANDLDTLPANSLISRLKGIPLVYDSHEYFTEVPELQGRKNVQAIWRWFELRCIKFCEVVITVSPAIVDLLSQSYSLKNVFLVRNVPQNSGAVVPLSKQEMNVDENKKLLVFQGNGINRDRGGEELIDAMKTLEHCQLLIIGDGDVIPELKRRVKSGGMDAKVKFIDTIPFELLMRYTAAADIGLSLDKDTNINYRFSLPNKVFDYAMAGTAVLAGELPEVGKIIREFKFGQLCSEISPDCIARKINEMLDNPIQLKAYGKAGKEFAEVVNWKQEFQPVLTRLSSIGKS